MKEIIMSAYTIIMEEIIMSAIILVVFLIIIIKILDKLKLAEEVKDERILDNKLKV